MIKYVNDTAAGKNVNAYVILKRGKHIATVRVAYSNSGACLVNVHQWGESVIRSYNAANKTKIKTKESDYDSYADYRAATDICEDYSFQHDKRGGYGYDKFISALSGMVIDGHILSDHCGGRLKAKTDSGLFPHGTNAPKGYSFANYVEKSKKTGRAMHEHDFDGQARKNLGFGENADVSDAEYKTLVSERNRLFIEWRKSDDFESGYSSCFKESGLKYLESIGYTIIAAI